MKELEGKKLLILGANSETIPIIETAKNMGAYTIVTDYNPDAPAKRYADKSYNVNGIDIEGLVKLGKEETVDGVIVGVADLLVPAYQEVCERLNKPCYATKEQVKCFNNKYYFKRMCERYGVLGVPEYQVNEQFIGEMNKVQFPVIVKPVDACSGKGITLCYNKSELKSAIAKAKDYSLSGEYLVERYMTCDDVSIYYTIKDGEYFLSLLSDRYTTKKQYGLSSICIGDIFPSKYLDVFLKDTHIKLKKMFSDLNMKNGIIYISAFYENGEFYVYDPGFRLQGGGFHLILNAMNGFDHREMLIRFALTGKMGNENLNEINNPAINNEAAAVDWFLLKEGKITKIEGLEKIKNSSNVFHIIQRFVVGDIITKDMIGTEQQVFLRVFLKAKNKEELKKIIEDIRNSLIVKDEKGDNMVLDSLKEENFYK